jgi:hypothetical protein
MTPMHDLGLTYGQLRSLVLDFLAMWPDTDPLELNTLREGLGAIAHKRGLGGLGSHPYSFTTDPALSVTDFFLSCEIVWDLVIEGVVRPGHFGSSQNMPQFHLTERGRELLKHGSMSPYDPDGYLKRLDANVPNLDPVIRTYLVESMHTLRIGCLLSSTITLGCASECAILNLIDAYSNALPKPEGDALKKKTKDAPIKTRFDQFVASAEKNDRLKSAVPKELKETVDTPIRSLFGMYRVHRNDAGHPTGKQLSPEEAHSHLVVFPHYIERLYSLIGWLKSNQLP